MIKKHDAAKAAKAKVLGEKATTSGRGISLAPSCNSNNWTEHFSAVSEKNGSVGRKKYFEESSRKNFLIFFN